MNILLLLWILVNLSFTCAFSPQSWCKYLQKTKEPPVIIYNRIPKCGSSTVQHIVSEEERRSHGKVVHVAASVQYWGKFYDQDEEARKELYKFIKDAVKVTSSGKSVVIDGHWHWHELPKFDNREIEYMQLTRKCEDRVKSSIMYTLSTSLAAREAKKKKKFNEYLSARLNTDVIDGDISVCLSSLNCLQNSSFASLLEDGTTAKFYCGVNCVANNGNDITAGAIEHISNPLVGYTAVGIMEYMQESMAMFECAFPKAFKDAESRYKRHQTHDRPSQPYETTEAMRQFMNSSCAGMDAPIYNRAKELFLERYKYMQDHRDKCCR